MWGVGCHMGGADQDIKFANSLSGEEGRRRGVGGEDCWQTSINRAEKWRQGSPLETPLWQGVFSLSIWEPFVKLAARYSRWGEWASRKKTTSWSHVKERLKKVLLILCWIDHLGFLFWLHSHWWGRQRVDQDGGLAAKPTWRTLLSPATVSRVYLHNGETWSYSISGPTHRRKAQWPATWGGIFHCSWPPPLTTLHSKRAEPYLRSITIHRVLPLYFFCLLTRYHHTSSDL